MPDITPFDFHGHQVRVITADDGEPRFVLKDLCTVLEIGNARQVRARLDPDGVSQTDVIDSMGRTQSATVVDESGMYEVVLRSDKKEATEFRRWVTRDVLPSIRRTGTYSTPAPVAALPDRRALAQMVLEAEDRADKATAELEAAAPKVDYHDKFIAEDQDVITVEDWGRQWGLSRPEAFQALVSQKIVFRKSVTREFSNKHAQVIDRNEYRPYAGNRHFFELRPQHNAPRYHNGQVRQTLYVRAAASFLLANAARIPGTPGGDQLFA